jgi:cephalosporin hydroxylase
VVEGDSVEPTVVDAVRSQIAESDRVLVILDSCHAKSHVLAELEAYHRFVSCGSYIVATDGIMRDLIDVPGGVAAWDSDNPAMAAVEFAASHPEFFLEPPKWRFNESSLTKPVTYWPQAWLRYGPESV